jgi:hypothetical protein
LRYLWFTSGIMIVAGVVLIVAARFLGLGPVSLVCGLLLVWSGIVKIIVLRIWQKTLANPSGTTQRMARDDLAPPPRLL